MAVNKDFVVTPSVTTTGTLMRTVADWIYRLNPAIAPICALSKSSGVDKMGDASYGKGLIGKSATKTIKYEWYTSTPITIYHTATGGSSTTAEIASTANFIARDKVVNLSTLDVGIVNTLTSSTVLTITAVGGTWSCTAGDVIAIMNNAQEEASSTAVSRTQEPDNNHNYVGIYRFPTSIADTAKNSPHYGEQLVSRYKKDNMYFALRNIENDVLFGKRASSETTSVTIGGVAYNMYSTRGLLNYAATTVDMSGTVDFDRLNLEVANQLPNTLNPDSEIQFLAGTKINNWIQNMASKNFMWDSSGKKDIYGVEISRFYMGKYKVRMHYHEAFDHGAMQNQFVMFDSGDLELKYYEGLDMQIKENIQLPATMGRTDELRGTVGLLCKSGGANVVRGINWVTQ